MSKERRAEHAATFAALTAGALLCLAFFGLWRTATGMWIAFLRTPSMSTPGELQLWLGHALLLWPGACLCGYGLAPWLGPRLAALWARAARLEQRELVAVLAVIFFAAAVAAASGHVIFLLDHPFTDDENAARFGGQILAMGRLTIPVPEPFAAFPKVYLFARHGALTTIDFLGGQLAWAAAEVSGLGPVLFALAAAIPAACVGYVAAARLGAAWGICASALFLVSPMAFALSLTTHAHLLSRAFFALGLCAYFVALARRRMWPWAACGMSFGIAFLCRPTETVALALPLLVCELWCARREKRLAQVGGGLVAGGLGPLALFLAHNAAITGNPLLMVRLAHNDIPLLLGYQGAFAWLHEPALLWSRFGANTGYNLLMLSVWFLGPIGLPLVALGAGTDRFTKLLTIGVVLALALGLLHDDYGIHSVGPIHYSECAVPLVVLATTGLKRVRDALRSMGVGARPIACGLLVGALSFGVFNLEVARALRRQASIQDHIYGFLESSGIHGAVVLAPRFFRLWGRMTEAQATGSFVFEWRYPRPDFGDDILILHDAPGVEPALRQRFPERPFYRLTPSDADPFLTLVALDPAP